MSDEVKDDVVHEPACAWFVWTKKGHKPCYVHESRESALAEAERLARLHPGAKFHVMRSVEKVSIAPLAASARATGGENE